MMYMRKESWGLCVSLICIFQTSFQIGYFFLPNTTRRMLPEAFYQGSVKYSCLFLAGLLLQVSSNRALIQTAIFPLNFQVGSMLLFHTSESTHQVCYWLQLQSIPTFALSSRIHFPSHFIFQICILCEHSSWCVKRNGVIISVDESGFTLVIHKSNICREKR